MTKAYTTDAYACIIFHTYSDPLIMRLAARVRHACCVSQESHPQCPQSSAFADPLRAVFHHFSRSALA